MISVIIPVYNAEEYLKQCVESVLSQSYIDIELLLVDDGSRDSSGEICEAFMRRDDRVHVIHKENGGVSEARNTGLAAAVGEYVSFVDADDWVEPTYLDGLVRGMTPDGFSVTGVVRDDEPAIKGSKVKYLSRKEAEISVLSGHGIKGWSVARLFDMSTLRENKICFSGGISQCEDELFCIQYLSCINGNITVSNEAKYHYRSNPKGALMGRYCKKTPDKRNFSEILAVERMEPLLDEDKEVQDAWQQRRTKAAAATLRTMVSCHYEDKTEIARLKKIVRRGCFRYIRGDVGAASSKISVFLSAVSPELEWRIYKLTALRL